ncbi:MAG: pyrroline-5-carboxylate reductase [Oscillospiraceae bacterium]|nr:pyrroline-5-carboxylate reductase [Oscillospiraceae bacterium]
MNKTVAFIGSGAMASAILRGTCRTQDSSRFLITDIVPGKAEELAKELGCRVAASNEAAIAEADIVVLCVKPQYARPVLEEIAPSLRDTQKVLCSVLAGTSIETIRTYLGAPDHPIVRIMPNTPAHVGKGQMLITAVEQVSEEAKADVLAILAPCGTSVWIPESLFDQGTALSGSSPAFVYLFIEAMADAGVESGFPRAQALELAARAVYGAAAMVLETGEHPSALKDKVCSPSGTTIAGVTALDEHGFRFSVISAIRAACARSKAMGEGK